MKGQKLAEPEAPVPTQTADLEDHLESSKERLSVAATQLVELARLLLAPDPYLVSTIARPSFRECVVRRMIANVQLAEAELAKARELALHPDEAPPPHKIQKQLGERKPSFS